MKLMTLHLYKKQILPLFIVTFLSLFIWFLGPSIIIANHLPFFEPIKRFYIIVVFFLVWALKIIFVDTSPAKTISPPITLTPEVEQKLEILRGRFQGALNFLKKTILQSHGKKYSLSNLPWYLFIGGESSGKTTLLAQSDSNFILS